MRIKGTLLTYILLIVSCSAIFAQSIKGEVVDKDRKTGLGGVTIENMYTALIINTNDDGSFSIAASQDQLLEFKKPGYQSARLRIPKGYTPPYFKIIMEHGFSKPGEMLARNNNRYDNRADSLRFRELYKHELDFEKLSAIGSIAHPFSALSKRNREIWRFQETYNETEQEKYIDKTFNEELINKFTGLSGDSLKRYMMRFRPGYEQLRGMNDYSFFTFIKRTANIYRHPNRPNGSQ
ncbi:MAG: hypothetical protein H7257_03815 [Taibaiella sp.]|nr:hypothetical protein [Taibaiella sp.]